MKQGSQDQTRAQRQGDFKDDSFDSSKCFHDLIILGGHDGYALNLRLLNWT
jgi:hypothetical protein